LLFYSCSIGRPLSFRWAMQNNSCFRGFLGR
jgi:hypothetical protein